ncbi:MAG: hypothetical protein DRH10_03620 [Deltaproteobacteria bacterium]|nr:MAG: hypothetical protein DRH10_03620 [Deltaproteobacteria bacterium]
METKKIEIKTLLLSLATVIFVELVARAAVSGGKLLAMIGLGAARLVEATLIMLIVSVWGGGTSSVGLARSTILYGIRKGVLWSAVFGVATAFVFIALFLLDIDPLRLIYTPLPEKPGDILLFFAVGGLVSPVAEELFFRGILYGFFRRWGVFAAVLLSTLVFVLVHPVASGIPLPQIVGGILFALAYEVEKSLTTPIAIHILGNMAIFSLSGCLGG